MVLLTFKSIVFLLMDDSKLFLILTQLLES